MIDLHEYNRQIRKSHDKKKAILEALGKLRELWRKNFDLRYCIEQIQRRVKLNAIFLIPNYDPKKCQYKFVLNTKLELWKGKEKVIVEGKYFEDFIEEVEKL